MSHPSLQERRDVIGPRVADRDDRSQLQLLAELCLEVGQRPREEGRVRLPLPGEPIVTASFFTPPAQIGRKRPSFGARASLGS